MGREAQLRRTVALASLGSTGRGGPEQPRVKMRRSDVEAACREHQEKQLVELSLQMALLASPAAWERTALNCSLAGPWPDPTWPPAS